MPKKKSCGAGPPILYGLLGFSHGWARILTVMSPQGIAATIATIQPGEGTRLQADEGTLPQYHERREGALDKLAAEHGIAVLTKPEWDARKQQFGDAIYK
ncbi:MAG: hypothetical protein OEZ03_08425 [Alphaproteobacteria bacterium]|nr:hypothetical protein [Alphaproteobacteria bacterium]